MDCSLFPIVVKEVQIEAFQNWYPVMRVECGPQQLGRYTD
jgi:hypothetical protein